MAKYQGADIYCDSIIPLRSDGELDIEVVKETDTVLAFKHTHPHWPVHVVVVPKTHVSSLLALPDHSELARDLLEVINEVSQTVLDGENKCRVQTNLGEYQDSKHLHFHVSSGAPFENKN